jgi:hypothetical protein
VFPRQQQQRISAVAHPSHKRDTNARRSKATLVAGPLAVIATVSAVGLGVLAATPAKDLVFASNAPVAAGSDFTGVVERNAPISRSVSRADLARKRAVKQADTRLWTTAPLNVWSEPGDRAAKLGVIEAGKRVLVTGRHLDGRDEIVVDGKSRWVTSGYLAKDKPVARTAAAGGLTMAPCPDGSVENGLTNAAVYVYRSVCHAFPQITSYGGWDAHGEHSSGKAIDIMTSDKALGDQIAAYLQSHASELHLYDVIWWDRIWTPERASEGWRYYGDHGSATANHMDHVHVSVY